MHGEVQWVKVMMDTSWQYPTLLFPLTRLNSVAALLFSLTRLNSVAALLFSLTRL